MSKRIFLNWDKPLVDLAVANFAENWNPDSGPLDLSNLVIIVPTGESGRRLRAKFAEFAAQKGGSVLSPLIKTPNYLLSDSSESIGVPNKTELTAIWCSILKKIDLPSFKKLFPNLKKSQNDFAFIVSVAERLIKLRLELGENGLNIQQAYSRHSKNLAEDIERWKELADLEKIYFARLNNRGLKDPETEKQKYFPDELKSEEFSKLIFLGLPDPVPLILKKLANFAENKIETEFWINAPANFADFFDKYGRPLSSKWKNHELSLKNDDLYAVSDAFDMAEKLSNLLEGLADKNPGDELSFSLISPDRKFAAFAKDSLERHFALHSYDPALDNMNKFRTVVLLRHLKDFFIKEDYKSFSSIVRHPDFCEYASKEGDNFSFYNLDRIQNKVLAEDFESLKEKLEKDFFQTDRRIKAGKIKYASKILASWKSIYIDKPFDVALREILSSVYGEREFDSEDREDQLFFSAVEQIKDQVENFNNNFISPLNLENDELFELFIRCLADEKISIEHQPEAVPLQGWLETVFDDSRHMIISGMTEGTIPASVMEDVFLPDSIKKELGLRHIESRYSRDVFILESIINARCEENSGVQVIVNTLDADGNAVKPSRLLYQCSDEILLKRLEKLLNPEKITQRKIENELEVFKNNEAEQWLLKKPSGHRQPERVSASAFKDYLECPFRFFLKRCLKMEHIRDDEVELDAAGYGSLCHDVLEAFGKDSNQRTETDGNKINKILQKILDEKIKAKFGDNPPTMLILQKKSLSQRLRKAAEIHAESRQKGWEIIDTELDFSSEINGMNIMGKIDLVEYHKTNNSYRILDYKTGKAESPESKHLKSGKKDDNELLDNKYFSYTDLDGKSKNLCWLELQIPLYVHFFREMLKNEKGIENPTIECGYFSIPKAVSTTQIHTWDNITDFIGPALNCAVEIVEKIRNKIYWPPVEKNIKYDDFKELFSGKIKEALAINSWENSKRSLPYEQSNSKR